MAQRAKEGKGCHIEIKKGLDIPMDSKPAGNMQNLPKPKTISLDLSPFQGVKFKLLKKEGPVKLGEPIAFVKGHEEILFVAPAGGIIKEIRRGLKRRLLDIVIEVAESENKITFETAEPKKLNREAILEKICKAGLFPRFRMRPFNVMANPKDTPKSIFVKGVASDPYACTPEMQVEGKEKDFQTGLDALAKLTEGSVHLVYRAGSTCKAFSDAKSCLIHTVSGPHPAGNVSVHIHNIDPIQNANERIWTLTAKDVVAIGHLFNAGEYFTDRIISLGGSALLPKKSGFFKAREGYPVSEILQGRNENVPIRIISGSVLTGAQVDLDGYLSFYDESLAVLPENTEREMFHFFRLGSHKFTASKTYLSGFLKDAEYSFSTNQHGEHRAFVDGAIYDQYMPMQIPTLPLVKAIMTKNFEEAEALGMLEVDGEDFALASFVDPCKNEMNSIVTEGLRAYASEVVG